MTIIGLQKELLGENTERAAGEDEGTDRSATDTDENHDEEESAANEEEEEGEQEKEVEPDRLTVEYLFRCITASERAVVQNSRKMLKYDKTALRLVLRFTKQLVRHYKDTMKELCDCYDIGYGLFQSLNKAHKVDIKKEAARKRKKDTARKRRQEVARKKKEQAATKMRQRRRMENEGEEAYGEQIEIRQYNVAEEQEQEEEKDDEQEEQEDEQEVEKETRQYDVAEELEQEREAEEVQRELEAEDDYDREEEKVARMKRRPRKIAEITEASQLETILSAGSASYPEPMELVTPPAGHTRSIAQKKKRKKTSGSEKVRTKQKRSDEARKKPKMTSRKDA